MDKVFARKFDPATLNPNSLWYSSLFTCYLCGDRWNCSIFEQGKNLWQRFPDEPEPELRYRFYCISVLIKFIAVVFEPSIFRVINLLRIPGQNLNITSCTFKNVDTNFPSIISPANFKNANSPPIISPSEYKPLPKISPSKRSFEKYKPWGLFSEFYVISAKLEKQSLG